MIPSMRKIICHVCTLPIPFSIFKIAEAKSPPKAPALHMFAMLVLEYVPTNTLGLQRSGDEVESETESQLGLSVPSREVVCDTGKHTSFEDSEEETDCGSLCSVVDECCA